MKKFISILTTFSILICSTVSCFGYAQGDSTSKKKRNDNTSTVVSCLSAALLAVAIGGGLAYVIHGKESINFKKQVTEPLSNFVGTTWDNTKYASEKVWNGAKSKVIKACNDAKYGVEKAGNVTKNAWCKYIGLGCGKNSTLS